MSGLRTIAWPGLALALALGCGSAEPEAPAAERAAAPSQPAATASAVDQEPLPPEGHVTVRFGADGIVVLANRAPRRAVLESLARETGLLVVAFVEGGDPNGRVSLRSQGEPVEVVVARALAGVPYSVEPLASEGRARVTVVAGRRQGAEAPREVARREAPRVRPEPPAVTDEETLRQIASPDPVVRAEAVEFADVSSAAGYQAVLERLQNDPDPTVRAMAAETLGDADVGAVRPLLDALEDPDARVVLAALESLELLGDASTLPGLAVALDHPDPEVRERAAEVKDFLE